MSKEKLIELKLAIYKTQDDLMSIKQKNMIGTTGKEYASHIVDIDILLNKIQNLNSEYTSLLNEVSKNV